MCDTNSKSLKELEKLIKSNRVNKRWALGVVLGAVLLSFVLVWVCLCKYDSYKPTLQQEVITNCLSGTQQAAGQPCEMANCKMMKSANRPPMSVTKKSYNNTVGVLLCCGIIVFVAVSLWGAFTMLFKVLKSERDVNAEMLSVYKYIYKEMQMWELAKQKTKQ